MLYAHEVSILRIKQGILRRRLFLWERYAWWLRCCTHAMNSSTPSIVYVRKGKTTANNVRSCDTVRAGAFFPQVQLQVP